MLRNVPKCPKCGWSLSFTEENGQWVARCWNKPNPPSKPTGCPIDIVGQKPSARAASYLSPPDFQRLDLACYAIYRSYGPPYLVGSVLQRPDFRDIDLRCILADEEYDGMFPPDDGDSQRRLLLLNVSLSKMIADAAQVAWPIDFQFQRRTDANAEFSGMRNPMGLRWAHD